MSDESIAVALEMMEGYSRITWLEVIKKTQPMVVGTEN
jgi:hypothetical protein